MLGAVFCGVSQLGRQDPLVGPGEDCAVGRGRGGVVVLAGDVEREVDEELAVGFDEGGEPIPNN
jgi:hypothetical protein